MGKKLSKILYVLCKCEFFAFSILPALLCSLPYIYYIITPLFLHNDRGVGSLPPPLTPCQIGLTEIGPSKFAFIRNKVKNPFICCSFINCPPPSKFTYIPTTPEV